MSPDHLDIQRYPHQNYHYCSVCGHNHEGTACHGPKDMRIYYPPEKTLTEIICPHCGEKIKIEMKK